MTDRKETIQEIKTALKRRSGRAWSVTGGHGTAWGWITIGALPSKRTCHSIQRPGTVGNPGDYDDIDTGQPCGYMTLADRNKLGELLGLNEPVHCQGVKIPASNDYWTEYIDRANGHQPSVTGKPYWD